MRRKLELSFDNYLKIKDEVNNYEIKEKDKLMFEYERIYIRLKTLQKIAELILFPFAIASFIMFLENAARGRIIEVMFFIFIDLLIALIGGIAYSKIEYNTWYINKVVELLNENDK